MRFLFVSANEWEPWGGSEELWGAAAQILRRRGFDVLVSVKHFGAEPARILQLRRLGCRIHYRRKPFRHPNAHLAIQRALRYVGLEYFGRTDLVIISQGMNMDGLAWMQACIRRGLRYVVIAQAASESTWIFDRDAEALAEGYERAERCFFVSQANLELTRKQLAIPLSRSEIVRNPFNIPYDTVVPWPDIDADRELRFACIGRLDPRAKGQDLILEVLRLPHWRERAVRVSFVGKGHAERGLRRLAQVYDLQSVRFSGPSTDIAEVWREHHALLLTSRFEGLPLVLVEAMLAGRPAVATNVGGNAEVLTDGVTGFLAAAPTVAQVDGAMNAAWNRRGDLRDMGAAAASAIRRLVPADPAGVFAERLEEIATG